VIFGQYQQVILLTASYIGRCHINLLLMTSAQHRQN